MCYADAVVLSLEPEFIQLCQNMRASVEALKWDFKMWTDRPKVHTVSAFIGPVSLDEV
jgi:hypothetical protein